MAAVQDFWWRRRLRNVAGVGGESARLGRRRAMCWRQEMGAPVSFPGLPVTLVMPPCGPRCLV